MASTRDQGGTGRAIHNTPDLGRINVHFPRAGYCVERSP